MKLFNLVALAVVLGGSFAFGEPRKADDDYRGASPISEYHDEFTASPRIVRLAVGDSVREVCVMYVTHKGGGWDSMSVLDVGPGNSCAAEIADYVGVGDERAIARGLKAFQSKFTGEPYEVARTGGDAWRFVVPPSSIYYRVIDTITGEEHWGAVCVGLMKYDDRRKVGFRSIVYPRENSRDPITSHNTPEVKCGGIQFAVRNEIRTEKPKFLGSAEEIEKLTRSNARASVGQNEPNH